MCIANGDTQSPVYELQFPLVCTFFPLLVSALARLSPTMWKTWKQQNSIFKRVLAGFSVLNDGRFSTSISLAKNRLSLGLHCLRVCWKTPDLCVSSVPGHCNCSPTVPHTAIVQVCIVTLAFVISLQLLLYLFWLWLWFWYPSVASKLRLATLCSCVPSYTVCCLLHLGASVTHDLTVLFHH